MSVEGWLWIAASFALAAVGVSVWLLIHLYRMWKREVEVTDYLSKRLAELEVRDKTSVR